MMTRLEAVNNGRLPTAVSYQLKDGFAGYLW